MTGQWGRKPIQLMGFTMLTIIFIVMVRRFVFPLLFLSPLTSSLASSVLTGFRLRHHAPT